LWFDITTDTAERHNIAHKKPEIVAQIQLIIEKY